MLDKLVLIDICGTLYDSNTTMDFLDYTFKQNRNYRVYRWISRLLFVRAINKLLLQCFSYDLIRSWGIYFLKGISSKEMQRLVDVFYDSFLIFRKQVEPIRIIEKYREEGYHLLLVSATLDCVACKIAEELRIPQYISSELLYEEGFCVGRLFVDLLHNKYAALKRNGYDYPYMMTISDNMTDADLMSLSRECYIVCDESKKRQWLGLVKKYKIKNYYFIIKS